VKDNKEVIESITKKDAKILTKNFKNRVNKKERNKLK
jgi:hypothetical protein